MTRACNGCSMCCYLPEIEELAKPADAWCKHCTQHSCRAYEARPQPCRDFKCAWLADARVADHWYPKRAKMLLYTAKNPKGELEIRVRVHPKHPGRWQQEPYYAEIRRFAELGLGRRPHVHVYVSCRDDSWLVFPDGQVRNPGVGVVVATEKGHAYLPTGSEEAADALLKFIGNRI